MKAKQLVGVVTSGILITAGVVVSFVQHAATTLNRRAHSSSQIASTNNDLTSLLETTKYDIETGKQLARTTGSKITNTAISTPIPTGEASKAIIKPLSSLKTSLLEISPPEDDKALPLGNFIKATLSGHNSGSASPDSSSWDTAAANVGLIRDNLFGLIGKESPHFQLPDHVPGSIGQYFKDLPEDAKPWLAVATGATLVIIGGSRNIKTPSKKVPNDSTESSIQATSDAIGSLTDELGSLQSRMKSLEANGLELDSKLKDATSKLAVKELDISKARLKAADISLNLGREIDLLKQKLDENDEKVVSLDADLAKARAECKLLVNELDKAKAKNMKKVSLESIKEKKVNDAAAKKTKKVRSGKTAPKISKPKKEKKSPLAYTNEAELSTKKKVKEKNPVASAAKKKTASPKKEATKVQTEELPTAEVKSAAKKNTASQKKEAAKVQTEKLPTAEVKCAAKKRTVSPKKESTKVQTEELPTAEAPLKKYPPKKKSRVQKKAVTKVKKTTKDIQKVSATKDTTPEEIKMESDSPKVSPKGTPEKGDLTTLSKSALSRKTVKELREFLESKGLSITENDGKPLKKNGLLEAVRSL